MTDVEKQATSSPYTQSTLFKGALAEAKTLASRHGQKVLSLQHLLVGFASAKSGWDEVHSELQSRMRALVRPEYFGAAKDKLGDGASPPDKLPLADDLRAILKDSGQSAGDVLHGLLQVAESKSGLGFQVLGIIAPLANRAAGLRQNAEISPTDVLVGALNAFTQGLLFGAPEVCALLAANHVAVAEVLPAAEIEGINPSTDQMRPFATEISSCLLDSTAEGLPILNALNLGLNSAVNIFRRKKTAYHEAGHAVVSSVLRPELPVVRVSIVQSGDALGVTSYDPNSPFWSMVTQSDLRGALAVALAGRAAEQIKFGIDQADSGASSDLTQATRRAWEAITRWGLDEEFGPVDLSVLAENSGGAGGALQAEAQLRVRSLLKEADEKAKRTLTANWRQIEALVAVLLEKGEVDYHDFIKTMSMRTLAGLDGAVSVSVRPTQRSVSFAAHSGVTMTREGPVRFSKGDALVSAGDLGSWPVARSLFEKTYSALGSIYMGQPGDYGTKATKRLAMRVNDLTQVYLSGGRGIHLSQEGDWVVDYGDGDLAIVSDAAMKTSYRFDEV